MAKKDVDREENSKGISGVILGQAFWLVLHSRSHEFAFVKDLQWSIVPALALRQFTFVSVSEKNPQAQAMGLWAFVDEEVDKRLSKGIFKLKPSEWNSGKTVWLIDVIAPFGGSHLVIKELREKVFPKGEIKSYVRDPKTGEGGVEIIHGAGVEKDKGRGVSTPKKKS